MLITETREDRRARRNQMMKDCLSKLHESDREKIKNNIPIKDTYIGGKEPKVKLSPYTVKQIIDIAQNTMLSDSEVGSKIRIIIQQNEDF